MTTSSRLWVWFVVFVINLESSVLSLTTDSNSQLVLELPLDYSDSEEIEEKSLSELEPRPIFHPDNPKNVTVHRGSTAFLHCRVDQIQDKTVRMA
jgi:hypothetical protein